MKLSRRGKRTKRTKRTKCTKRFKLKRNTKKQFRQYKRKNTYRKHSHKLRKNKRVMRGGDNVTINLPNNNVELEYTTSDDSLMNKVRGFLNKLQRGNFSYSISYDNDEDKQINQSNDVFTREYETEQYEPNEEQILFSNILVEPNHTYNFTLTMTKDAKTLVVKFTITVESYELYIKRVKISHRVDKQYKDPRTQETKTRYDFVYFNDIRDMKNKFYLDDKTLTYHVTYTSGNDTTITPIQFNQNGRLSGDMVIKTDSKTYTFPIPNGENCDDKNCKFFSHVVETCKKSILSRIKEQLKSIEVKINNTTTTTTTY